MQGERERAEGRSLAGTGVRECSGRPWDRGTVAAIVALAALFLLFAVLVHQRLLIGLDLLVARSAHGFASAPLDVWSAAAAVLVSAEFSLAYALVASLLLWRMGLRILALAPLAFIPLDLLEILLKMTLNQPLVPAELVRQSFGYPLISTNFGGSFPSGHALRTAFLCTFSAALLWRMRPSHTNLLVCAVGLLGLLVSATRIYMGYHWLSDVIAGLALGSAGALVVAPAVADALWPKRIQGAAPTSSPSDQ